MSKALRYIIVGTGGFGGYWCSTVLPRLAEMGKAVCAAAADIREENLKNARECLKLPAGKCYTDAKKAFDENRADFGIIVVPPAHHEEIVDVMIAHDVHVLSEKPLADTMEACVRIYRKVKKAGRKLAVTMSHRFDQDKQSLERLIRSRKYGRLDYLVGRNTWALRKFPAWGAFRYKIPDPLLVEGTVHHFDIMRSLSASDAKTVYAKTWNPSWSDFAGDCQALVTIEMRSGVKVFYEGAKANASMLNGWCQDYWRAECDKATLELDNRRLRVITGALHQDATIEEKPLEEQPVWMNPWIAEMFCDWLAGGDAPPTELDDNIQCAALLFAAIESAHTGKVVDVQEFLKKYLPDT
jgi:predicted dehydrogenase